MIYLNLSEYAKKHGVSRQRVHALVKEKRIAVWTPARGVLLVDSKHPYPDKRRVTVSMAQNK